MSFNRVLAKQSAKRSIAEARPSPLFVTLVFMLLTAGISAVIGRLLNNPFAEAADYIYRWGYDPEEVIEYVFQRSAAGLGTYAVVSLLFSLYNSVMNFGYVSYGVRLSRGENPALERIFDGFFHFSRVLWLNVFTDLFIGLWAIGGALPGLLLIGVGAVTQNYLLIMGAAFFLAAGTLMLGLYATLSYVLAPYVLLDNPDCTAREAISRSKTIMRGRKLEYFMLMFSFLGWYLLAEIISAAIENLMGETTVSYWLGMIAGNVLIVWLNPYIACTKAYFYDAATSHPQQVPPPVGGYGSNYGNDFENPWNNPF